MLYYDWFELRDVLVSGGRLNNHALPWNKVPFLLCLLDHTSHISILYGSPDIKEFHLATMESRLTIHKGFNRGCCEAPARSMGHIRPSKSDIYLEVLSCVKGMKEATKVTLSLRDQGFNVDTLCQSNFTLFCILSW